VFKTLNPYLGTLTQVLVVSISCIGHSPIHRRFTKNIAIVRLKFSSVISHIQKNQRPTDYKLSQTAIL